MIPHPDATPSAPQEGDGAQSHGPQARPRAESDEARSVDSGLSRTGPLALGTDDTSSIVQRRVGVLACLWGTLLTVGILLQTTGDVMQGHPERLLRGTTYLFSGAALVAMVLWRICRGRPRPLPTIYRLEALALFAFGLSTAWSAIGLVPDFISGFVPSAPLERMASEPLDAIKVLALNYGALSMTFACALALVTHSAIVPCSAGHVAWLAVVLIAPLAGVVGFGITPDIAPRVTRADRTQAVGNIVVWWTIGLVVSVVVNRVVHALRREVREARRLGQYVLEERIGAGGMGIVYRARHGMMRRPTAIKLLAERRDEEAVRRFEREVQLTARLTHPHTVTVYDYGRAPGGVFYYAMELLDGASLQEIVDADGPQPPCRVLHVLVAITSALIEAHEFGLVHRDIKPANILLAHYGGKFDFPKLLDFGLVQTVADKPHRTAMPATQATPRIHRNAAGAPTHHAGTPLYMAPETIRQPHSVDARADLYALGAVGYFALTGTPVFRASTVFEVLAKHAHAKPEPPSERLGKPIPADLEAAIMRCLAKHASDRPASARELLRSLEACADARKWTESRAEAWWMTYRPRPKHETPIAAGASEPWTPPRGES